MSKRDQYQPGVRCWVDTAQPNPRAAVEFYGDLFGWEFAGPGEMPGGGAYFVARVDGRDVAGVSSLPPEMSAGAAPAWSTYIAVGSADEATQKASSAGATVLVEPFDAPPAGRIAVLSDPAGASFCLWEPRERQGAQLVNEPGAWSMSLLATDDFQGSEEFYATVFGWNADPFEMGGSQMMLWRLPGYVGGERQQPVPSDVVGVMVPLSPGAPAAWSVDFWVRDADEVAARATERGGSVIVVPREVPGFRNAVLADPQGAVFSVSQLLAGA
jgi:predicted enzyme related to lactoylglutathione lyase